jgi:eukaryotic-like serine/threonine-protein kinase
VGETNRRVGDYEVLAALGTGGMGRVFKVRNVISNREEAMKILHPDFASDPDLAARFMAEIRTLAGLEHPGIAQLRTAFQYQNQFVMVMEYVEGTTLEKLEAESSVPLEQMLDYSIQVLAALSYAHGRGVTHRDIKPTNIMVTSHGVVKLMDFGIAKSTGDMQLTRPGTTMGSVYYMSPEQVRGGTVDARSDIYSFGVTLYEMLTGRRPFQADTSYSVLNAQLHETPTPPLEINPALSTELNNIVLRAMAKAPEQRFQSAEEFRNALKALRDPAAAPVPQSAVVVPQFSQVYAETQPSSPLQPLMTPMAPLAAEPQLQAAAAPQTPAFTPVPVPTAPGPTTSRTHRGLWIGLGALTATLALVAMVSLLPRFLSTHASQQASTQKPQNLTATPSDSETPLQPPAQTKPADPEINSNEIPVAKETAREDKPVHDPTSVTTRFKAAISASPAGKSTLHVDDNAGAQSKGTNSNAPNSNVSASPLEPPALEVKRVSDRMMNLDARVQSADAGVQQIRNQQQAQGLDIRGDVLASMNRMHNFMNQANAALARKDLDAANEYMERADHEIAALEKFLGH